MSQEIVELAIAFGHAHTEPIPPCRSLRAVNRHRSLASSGDQVRGHDDHEA
jgi:hypothetical protein